MQIHTSTVPVFRYRKMCLTFLSIVQCCNRAHSNIMNNLECYYIKAGELPEHMNLDILAVRSKIITTHVYGTTTRYCLEYTKVDVFEFSYCVQSVVNPLYVDMVYLELPGARRSRNIERCN